MTYYSIYIYIIFYHFKHSGDVPLEKKMASYHLCYVYIDGHEMFSVFLFGFILYFLNIPKSAFRAAGASI